MRKLASIQIIKEITNLPKADHIELATVQGWKCIVKKNEFKVGQLCVYIEVDSILSERPEFEFLRPKKFRVKTWKLNKFNAISQGIVFGLEILPSRIYKECDDVTEILGVTKYESEPDPITEFNVRKGRNVIVNYLMKYEWFRRTYMRWFLKGKDNRGFPDFIYKTDETRIQILSEEFQKWKGTSGWFVTEKCEGQSLTNFLVTTKNNMFFGLFTKLIKKFGVCSRNLYLETKYPCTWWNVTVKEDIEAKLAKVPFDVAIQGEICGPSIQDNIYKFEDLKLFVFNVKNINSNTYLSEQEIVEFCKTYGFTMVPIIDPDFLLPNTIDELVKYATGTSVLAPTLREGVVIRKGSVSFKVVSPEYLIKHNK